MFNSLLFMATLRCYGDLGCFGVDGPFQSVHRPISVVPQSPSAINVTVHLFTRDSADQSQPITWPFDVNKWRHKFSPSRRSMVVIHGFLEGGLFKPWVKALVQALLRADDFNVIVADWGAGAALPYHQAAANARLVGAILAQLITQLQDSLSSRPESFHLIGHSIGAHIAGYAGSRLGGRLGRITGLDPAQPYFEQTPPSVRLDPSDATFVDVIHSDIRPLLKGGMGIRRPVGHLDFYPNGGRQQPGCGGDVLMDVQSRKSDIIQGMRRWLTCRHQRAVELFTSSLNGSCSFMAVKCPSWTEFRRGECFDCGGGQCASLGLQADMMRSSLATRSNRSTKLFLRTSGEAPYCRFHHRITVSLVLGKKSTSLEGKMFARLVFASRQRSRRIALLSRKSYPPSHVVVGVIEGAPNDNVTSLRLTWRAPASTPLSYFNGIGQHLHFDHAEVETLETGRTNLFCLEENSEKKLSAGQTETLEPHENCTLPASDWPEEDPIGSSRDTNIATDDLD